MCYKYVDTQCLCAISDVDTQCLCAISESFPRLILSNPLKYTHKYIYTTTLLPPASAQVLAGETHLCDVSALKNAPDHI